MGFKRASNRPIRANLSLGDIAAQRSDATPGVWKCVECGLSIPSLQESWRKPADVTANFSCLFCQACAMRLNESMSVGLAPIQMSNFDKLNAGQYVPELGPQQPTQAAGAAPMKGVAKWKKLLD